MKANRQGRIGVGVANLFSGSFRNARDGATYTITHRSTNSGRWRILRVNSSGQHKARVVSFDYFIIETYILQLLNAVPPNKRVGKLLASLDSAGEQEKPVLRRRLRDALKGTIASIYLLVVPRGRWRLCALQVWFAGGNRQSYLIGHRRLKPDDFWGFPIEPTADLRAPASVEEMEEAMNEMSVEDFLRGDYPFSRSSRDANQLWFHYLSTLVTRTG